MASRPKPKSAMTLGEIRTSRPLADRAKVAATMDADIRRHHIDDGEEPDAAFRLVANSWPLGRRWE